MPVKISPIEILHHLGYEMVDIESDEDYLSALMESIVSLQQAGASGRARADILQEELIRVRKERKAAAPSAGMKATKKKISTSKFFDKKEKKSLPEGEMGGAIVKIGTGVDSIVKTLKLEKKQDKKHFSFLRKMAERFKRRRDENKLEFKIFDGIKKTATKLLAPMKNAWSEFLGFIGKVILGRVLFKILEWMGNKENQGKLQSIIKFFQDWWPVMLAGYLLFGNSLTSMVTGMLITMGKWMAPMLLAIGKLMLNPWVLAAMGTGAAIFGISKLMGKNKEEEGEEEGGEVEFNTGGYVLPTMEYEEGGYVLPTIEYKQGGFVSGPGGIDQVPARLTAGEFVMSKGAVQKYGANTLSAMNAAGGGTNRPTMGRYNVGGKAVAQPGVVTDPEKRKQQEAYMLKFVNEERVLQGMEPLTNLTYAPGVELTQAIGPGPRTKETSNTNFDFDKGIKTASTSKTVDGKTSFSVEMGQTTEEDRQKFFAENPHAAQLVNLKNQVELDNLGGDISASSKMNGGGLVQNFKNGGLVQYFQGGGQVRRVQMGRGAAKRRMEANKIQPIKKPKVIVAYEQEKQNMVDKPNTEKSSSEIPNFNVIAMRSVQKIKVLGISV